MRVQTLFPIFLTLGISLACSGGGGGAASSPPAKASRLTYEDPVDTSQWRFVRDPASTDRLLLLDLLAPDGAQGRGVSMVLGPVPPGLAWAQTGGAYAKNLVFNGPPTVRASLSGGSLRILDTQLSGAPVTFGGQPVLRLGLGLDSTATPQSFLLKGTHAGSLTAANNVEAFTPLFGKLQAE